MRSIAPPDSRGEGPLNSRGNILIPVLIAFAVVSSLYVVSTVLMNNSTAIHNRIRIGDDIDVAMNALRAQLLMPGLCKESFLNSDGTVVTWDPNTKISIDNIKFNSVFWKVGNKISPTITLKSIELRQPDNVTYPGEPNRSTNNVSRKKDDTLGIPPVVYTSYLAKLIVTFQSQGLGGARKSRSIYINVQILGGKIEFCYPATGSTPSNNNSFLNEMGTICNFSNSGSPGAPTTPASCLDPACTSFVVTGFKADGTPTCSCACGTPVPVIIGDPLKCYSGYSSSGTWICN